MSRTKVEQKAITKIRDLIDDIKFFKHDLNENDKGISWDGTIEMYNGDTDKKENYDYTIDVQVKGRTTPNKKLSSKPRFDLDRVDLENYLKKDGTLLLLVMFKSDESDYRIYYANLLPYNIRELLKQYSSCKVKIDMREVTSSSHFENICRNFKLDKEMQKGINENIFNEDKLTSNAGKITKFCLWEKDMEHFDIRKLVGTWRYLYTLDENGYTINVSYGELTNLIEKINAKIYGENKEIIYDDVKLETLVGEKKILFGKAFSIDLTNKKFNIKICGTLSERIKQLKFIQGIFKNKRFFINDNEFTIFTVKKHEKRFANLLEKYMVFDGFFKNHNITKDINLDDFDDKDFKRLDLWINAINNKTEISLQSEVSQLGSIKIKGIRLSMFAKVNENKKFEIESLWNSNIVNKYHFKYSFNQEEIETNNLYLVLNSQAYQSDDINIQEMKSIFENKLIKDEEYTLMNLQVLEVLKAYDITKKDDLLQYAKYLATLLLKHEPNNSIYYINYAQILKREKNITEENLNRLIEIRDTNDSLEIKLGCNLLLENKKEINLLISKLDSQTIKIFKEFPISNYL